MADTQDTQKITRQWLARPRQGVASIIPEHVGDVFFLFLLGALAAGAMIFWLFAWLPTSETPSEEATERIPFFSDEELDEIVKILKAREEASTAPVIPPTRDPFK